MKSWNSWHHGMKTWKLKSNAVQATRINHMWIVKVLRLLKSSRVFFYQRLKIKRLLYRKLSRWSVTMVTKATGRYSKELITKATVRWLLIFGGTRYWTFTQIRHYTVQLFVHMPELQFAPSGGRKCVFQRPLCGAERPLVFSKRQIFLRISWSSSFAYNCSR